MNYMHSPRWFFLIAIAVGIARGQSPHQPSEDSLKLYRTPTVVVTGTRNPSSIEYTPVRVEVLQPLPTTSAGQTTVAEFLEESAGVLQQYRVRSGIQVMGLEPAYTLVLLNGQPLTGRVAGVIDLRRLPLGNIDRVEFVKGPMSSLYGSTALGGVVNILTPRPHHGWTLQLRTQHITRGGSELHARGGYGDSIGAVQLYSFFRRSQPFAITVDSISFPYAGSTEIALQAVAYWHPTTQWELQGDGRAFFSRTHGAFAETYGGQLAINQGAFRQREWSVSVSSSWTVRRARLQVGLFGNQYEELYYWDVAPTGTNHEDEFRQRLGRIWSQYDLLWNVRYRLTLGGEFLYEDALGTRYPDQPVARTIAVFSQWEGAPYDWLSYALSIRWDRPSAYGQHWSPKLALLLRPWGHRWVQVRTSLGSGFRAPDFRQLFVSFTNRLQGAGYALVGARRLGYELQPERSIATDVSLQLFLDDWLGWHPWVKEWTAEIRLFANWVRNLIEPFYVGRAEAMDVYSYRNLARIATRGCEVTLQGTVIPHPLWQLELRGSYQFLDAVDLDVLDAIAAGHAGTQDPSTGSFSPLRRADYGGLWGRSPHTVSGTCRIVYVPLQTVLSLRFLHRSPFGDEALDRNGIAVANPPRRVLDRPDEYVSGFWNLNLWLTQPWRLSSVDISFSTGIRNLLNVRNPRFLPHLVGRQWFFHAELRWEATE